MFTNDLTIIYIFSYLLIYNISLYILFNVLILSFIDIKFSNFLFKLNNVSSLRLLTLITLFSISGIPPFIGFFVKMSLLYYISFTSYMLLLILCFVLFIGLYFYLQNIRYLMWLEDDSVKLNNFNIKYINLNLHALLIFFSYILLNGFFIYDDLILCIFWIFY